MWNTLAAALVLLGAGTANSFQPDDAFYLHTAEAQTVAGPLQKLQPDGTLALGGNPPRQFPAAAWVGLRRTSVPLPHPPRGEQVVFASGDRLACQVQHLRDEQLTVAASFGKALAVPLTRVALIWFTASEKDDDAECHLRRLLTQRRTRDVVLLRNGDVLEGTVQELDDKTVRLEAAQKSVSLERDKVAAIALNSELSLAARPRGPIGHVILRDGSRLCLAALEASAKTLTGKTQFGAAVTIPLDRLVALDVHHGPAVYLSDLKPAHYEHTPYLGVRWPFTADTSVAGHPLRLAGSVFDKGIGMHSASRLTYSLGGNFRWFEARVGLDEQTGRAGSVRVQVLVDGKPTNLGKDQELTGRDPPRHLRVAVADARELTLVVEFGFRGDVADHVNWTDARLLK